MKTEFKPMRTICKGCNKKVFVDQYMVKYKRCKECVTGKKDFNTRCPDCNSIMDLIYWGGRDSPDEWECPKCEA